MPARKPVTIALQSPVTSEIDSLIPGAATVVVLLYALMQAAPTGATTFHFIRHAESTANAGTATTPEDIIDPPLADLGTQQALDLADDLAGHDVTTIYTSVLQRTQLTIAPAARELGITPVADARTNEW